MCVSVDRGAEDRAHTAVVVVFDAAAIWNSTRWRGELTRFRHFDDAATTANRNRYLLRRG